MKITIKSKDYLLEKLNTKIKGKTLRFDERAERTEEKDFEIEKRKRSSSRRRKTNPLK